jgi:hypothetical protein
VFNDCTISLFLSLSVVQAPQLPTLQQLLAKAVSAADDQQMGASVHCASLRCVCVFLCTHMCTCMYVCACACASLPVLQNAVRISSAFTIHSVIQHRQTCTHTHTHTYTHTSFRRKLSHSAFQPRAHARPPPLKHVGNTAGAGEGTAACARNGFDGAGEMAGTTLTLYHSVQGTDGRFGGSLVQWSVFLWRALCKAQQAAHFTSCVRCTLCKAQQGARHTDCC